MSSTFSQAGPSTSLAPTVPQDTQQSAVADLVSQISIRYDELQTAARSQIREGTGDLIVPANRLKETEDSMKTQAATLPRELEEDLLSRYPSQGSTPSQLAEASLRFKLISCRVSRLCETIEPSRIMIETDVFRSVADDAAGHSRKDAQSRLTMVYKHTKGRWEMDNCFEAEKF